MDVKSHIDCQNTGVVFFPLMLIEASFSWNNGAHCKHCLELICHDQQIFQTKYILFVKYLFFSELYVIPLTVGFTKINAF